MPKTACLLPSPVDGIPISFRQLFSEVFSLLYELPCLRKAPYVSCYEQPWYVGKTCAATVKNLDSTRHALGENDTAALRKFPMNVPYIRV